LLMEDDAGGDEKLLCVPVNKTFPYYADVVTYKDMPPIVLQQIEHFFTHYKDLEPGKWAKLNGWGDVDEAKRIIVECVERAKELEK
jgi:inorganic pyrophosphatase